MLSFRAVFKIVENKLNNVWNELDLTWYDRPTDDPYEFEYFEEENNNYVAWTEHLIRFHDWVLKYYSEGYSLYCFTINIYRDHDQSQDDILFSIQHYSSNYNNSIALMKEALGNYTEARNKDLKFINYVDQSSPVFNNIITLNKNLSPLLANSIFSNDDIIKINYDIESLFQLPYDLYKLNKAEREEIIKGKISLIKGYLKYLNTDTSNNTKKAKDSILLLINELNELITDDFLF